MKDKKFLALSGLFFLLFFAMISVASFDQQSKGIFTRASSSTFSPLKSFAVVFPQLGTAGNETSDKPPTKIKVSVYLRDVNGASMINRSVKLSASIAEVNITPSDTQTTNDLGMAQFFITSPIPGKIQLTATDLGSNTAIANIPSVDFTQ